MPRCAIRPAASTAGPLCRRCGGGRRRKDRHDGIPKHIVTDGPVVTKANAPGMLWMETHFLI